MTNPAGPAPKTRVVLNDFKRQWAEVGPQVLDAVRTVGESGWYILGSEVAAFENQLAAFWNRRFAVGVASGLDALEIGLRCLGCQPGDKVLMSPVSAFATALAAVKIGAIPVFIDCDLRGGVDLNLAARALSADPSIRFFIPVHLYGFPVDTVRLAELRSRFGVHIVEDCAQSIGASSHGIATGACGECAATSFYPTKNLGALGDGGAILTDSEEVAAAARELRDYGQASKYRHTRIGYNSRLDELHAAIMGRALLPRLNDWTARRRAIAERYLSETRNPLITIPGAPAESLPSWHLFPILAPQGQKSSLMAHLAANGIGSGEHYPIVLADQPAMENASYQEIGGCPTARELCSREVSLPIHPHLSDMEVSRVIEACHHWRG